MKILVVDDEKAARLAMRRALGPTQTDVLEVPNAQEALDRIQQILTYAPTSPAADRLRERVVVAG